MRTTISIDGDLLAALKKRAFQSGSTVSRLIEQAVRQALSEKTSKAEQRPFELVVFGAGAKPPAVNLDKVARLFEAEDEAKLSRK